MADKKETPVIPMGDKKVEAPQPPTYEQLQKEVMRLARQNQQMQYQLEQANYIIANKQLDYLFKVIEHNSMFEPAFVNQCVEEITKVLSPKEQEAKQE